MWLLSAATAWAQPQSQAAAPSPNETSATRAATVTFSGDTGLWFVPTAEVLAHGAWSASAHRRGTNEVQGFTNISDIAGTFAMGLGGRTEVFGSFIVDSRVDRDLRPLFTGDATVGGILVRYPRASRGWSGDNLGDLSLGAKFNLWSGLLQRPAALAVRAIVKLPTGDEDAGVSTGKADALFDFVVSKETHSRLELAGYAGYQAFGQPDGFDAPGGAFRWGVGGGFPARAALRGVLELNGQVPSTDGSWSPARRRSGLTEASRR